MKKKCLVFEAYPFFSGSQRITLNLCKVLKGKDYHLTLLLADDNFGVLTQQFTPYVDEIIYVNTNSSLLKYGNAKGWFEPSQLINSIFKGLLPFYLQCIKVFKNRNFDFYYFCDPRGATMLLPPAFLFRGKKIWHFHGKSILSKKNAQLFEKMVDKIICVSEDVATSLPVSDKKYVVYNGIDYSQYDNIDNSSAKDTILDRTSRYNKTTVNLLYAGLIRPQKGLHHLIYSFKDLVQKCSALDTVPVLFILGEAKTESEVKFKESLIQFCSDNEIDQYIQWIGWNNNVLGWMKSCDYFIFPSINKEQSSFDGFGKTIESTEGLPTVLIESSICQLFSIASSVTGVREIVTDHKNGIVYNSDSPNELTDLLFSAICERPKFQNFPDNSRFSLGTFQTRMISLFDSLS